MPLAAEKKMPTYTGRNHIGNYHYSILIKYEKVGYQRLYAMRTKQAHFSQDPPLVIF